MSMMEKPFLTYEQQIQKLKTEKKLGINNEEFALKLLKEYSYFDLISGYKGPFKGKDGTYKPHVCIEDVHSLYCFDDRLRALVLQYILKIEKHIYGIRKISIGIFRYGL